jgi:DNA-binding transcriptional regulator YhcF (GntR family)
MTSLTYDHILEAAVQVMLFVDHRVTIHFRKDSIQIQLPPTRKLAEHLQLPHYYVLPYLATMEKENVITRMERVGVSTTGEGSRRLFEVIANRYRKEAEALLSGEIFEKIGQQIKSKADGGVG